MKWKEMIYGWIWKVYLRSLLEKYFWIYTEIIVPEFEI